MDLLRNTVVDWISKLPYFRLDALLEIIAEISKSVCDFEILYAKMHCCGPLVAVYRTTTAMDYMYKVAGAQS